MITGECDLTIDRVIAGDDHRGTARLVDGEVRTVAEEKLQDLDRLPNPARHVLAKDAYSYSQLGGRGVHDDPVVARLPLLVRVLLPVPDDPGRRVARALRRATSSPRSRTRSGSATGNFLFRDATFTLSRKRTVEICELLIEKGLPITFWCETRINCLDGELLALLAKAGCKGINFGLESGSDDVLASGAKQGVNVQRIRKILRRHREGRHRLAPARRGRPSAGDPRLDPGDVPAARRASRASSLGVTGITPFPGTELWHDAMKNDWVKSTDWREYGGNGAPMITDNLSQDDMRFAARMMFDYFKMTRPESGATREELERHRAAMADWVAGGLAGRLTDGRSTAGAASSALVGSRTMARRWQGRSPSRYDAC